MIHILEKQNCCGCHACSQVCPNHCITMKADEEGFLYPVVDLETCIQCGLCEKVCPVLRSAESKKEVPKAYAAYNLDEEVRLASSSGGLFTLLAEYVLTQNGIIYGAAMENFCVKHIRVTDIEGLALLRGSKYVQSEIGQTYVQAKEDLETGKTVLFTGTPCQIEGLKTFLRKEYKNLITMDIICHGVPSPLVWRKYVELREKVSGAAATRVSFRHKKESWKKYSVLFLFSNNTAHERYFYDDHFMRAFLHDLCLRPSCYRCEFKKVNRVGDITVADFWGIQNVCPEMDDDRGTSLVIVHSEKGHQIMNVLSNKMRYREVNFSDAIKGNPSMTHSATIPKHRDIFMQKIHDEEFELLVQKYARDKVTIKGILKSVLSRTGLMPLVKSILKR